MANVVAVRPVFDGQRGTVDPVQHHIKRDNEILRRVQFRCRFHVHRVHGHLYTAHISGLMDTRQNGPPRGHGVRRVRHDVRRLAESRVLQAGPVLHDRVGPNDRGQFTGVHTEPAGTPGGRVVRPVRGVHGVFDRSVRQSARRGVGFPAAAVAGPQQRRFLRHFQRPVPDVLRVRRVLHRCVRAGVYLRETVAAVAAELGAGQPEVDHRRQRPEELRQVVVETGRQLWVRSVAVVVRHKRRVVLRHFHVAEPNHFAIFPGQRGRRRQDRAVDRSRGHVRLDRVRFRVGQDAHVQGNDAGGVRLLAVRLGGLRVHVVLRTHIGRVPVGHLTRVLHDRLSGRRIRAGGRADLSGVRGHVERHAERGRASVRHRVHVGLRVDFQRGRRQKGQFVLGRIAGRGHRFHRHDTVGFAPASGPAKEIVDQLTTDPRALFINTRAAYVVLHVTLILFYGSDIQEGLDLSYTPCTISRFWYKFLSPRPSD